VCHRGEETRTSVSKRTHSTLGSNLKSLKVAQRYTELRCESGRGTGDARGKPSCWSTAWHLMLQLATLFPAYFPKTGSKFANTPVSNQQPPKARHPPRGTLQHDGLTWCIYTRGMPQQRECMNCTFHVNRAESQKCHVRGSCSPSNRTIHHYRKKTRKTPLQRCTIGSKAREGCPAQGHQGEIKDTPGACTPAPAPLILTHCTCAPPTQLQSHCFS
jgi:hypothetical protein